MLPALPEPFLSWFHTLYVLLRDNDEKALFLVLLIEEAGIPLPMPGDLLIMFAGIRAASGEMTVLEVMITTTLGVLMGSTLLYTISGRVGHGLLTKYGKFIHLDQSRLEKMERWIRKRGAIMVLVGRLTPGLRTPTSIMAGTFQIPFPQFLFFAGLSALVWSGFWAGLGFYSGHSLLPLVRQYTHYSYYAAAVVVILLLIWVAWYRRRGHRRSYGDDATEQVTPRVLPASASGGSPVVALERVGLAESESPDSTG